MTKLEIVALGIRTKKMCQAPRCEDKATVKAIYDRGYGPENVMYYCAEHSYEEQGNVELDNRNMAAGFILY